MRQVHIWPDECKAVEELNRELSKRPELLEYADGEISEEEKQKIATEAAIRRLWLKLNEVNSEEDCFKALSHLSNGLGYQIRVHEI